MSDLDPVTDYMIDKAIFERLTAAGIDTPEPVAPAGIELLAAVGADGYPGNVAAGELIESAWGNATANKLREAPRKANRAQKTADEAGYAAVEKVVLDLTGVAGPTQTGRLFQFRYGLVLMPPTAAAPSTPSPMITMRLRVGTTVGGTLHTTIQHNWQENWRGFTAGLSLFGETAPFIPTAGNVYSLTFQSTGPTFAIGAGSYLVGVDLGG